MQRRLLGAFNPIERIWATVSSSRAGIMLPEVEDAGTTEGGREVMWVLVKMGRELMEGLKRRGREAMKVFMRRKHELIALESICISIFTFT